MRMNTYDYIIEQKLSLFQANFNILDNTSLIEESYDIYYDYCNSNYIDQLIIEESTDMYMVEETVMDTAKNNIDRASNKIKELWLKFKNWIKKLIDNIMISISGGEKLVARYKSKIIERANQLKDVTVNMALYKMDTKRINIKMFKIDKDRVTDDEIREMVRPGIIYSDTKERQIGEINMESVFDILSSKKKLQKFHTQIENEVKAEYDEILKYYSDNDKSGENNLKKAVNLNKVASKLCKAYTVEFKTAYKKCLAFVKHLLKSEAAVSENGKDDKEDYSNIGELSEKVYKDIEEKDVRICRIHLANSLIYDPTFTTANNMISAMKQGDLNIFVEHDGEKFESIKGKDMEEIRDIFNTQCVRFKSGKSSKERLKFMSLLAKTLYKDKRDKMLKQLKK